MGMNPQLRQALRAHLGRLNLTEQLLVCSDEGDIIARELDKFNDRKPCWVPTTKSAKAQALEMHSIVAVIMTCVATFMTPAMVVYDTKSCFIDGKVFCRDSNIDRWLTTNIPATVGGESKVLKLVRDGMTFRQMAQAVLNETSEDLNLLAKKLIEAGKTFSPKQVEERILAFQNGDKSVALLDNGWANFFFVHDDKGNVFVLYVGWGGRRWYVIIFRLDRGDQWRAGYQLFLRN